MTRSGDIASGHFELEPNQVAAGPSTTRGRYAGSPASQERLHVLEIVYTGILVLAFAFIAWFSVYVVYKLYQGQR
jgi:hypothetical protein